MQDPSASRRGPAWPCWGLFLYSDRLALHYPLLNRELTGKTPVLHFMWSGQHINKSFKILHDKISPYIVNNIDSSD